MVRMRSVLLVKRVLSFMMAVKAYWRVTCQPQSSVLSLQHKLVSYRR